MPIKETIERAIEEDGRFVDYYNSGNTIVVFSEFIHRWNPNEPEYAQGVPSAPAYITWNASSIRAEVGYRTFVEELYGEDEDEAREAMGYLLNNVYKEMKSLTEPDYDY